MLGSIVRSLLAEATGWSGVLQVVDKISGCAPELGPSALFDALSFLGRSDHGLPGTA